MHKPRKTLSDFQGSAAAAFIRDESVATSIEYGVITGVMALVLVPSISAAGWKVSQVLSKISESLSASETVPFSPSATAPPASEPPKLN